MATQRRTAADIAKDFEGRKPKPLPAASTPAPAPASAAASPEAETGEGVFFFDADVVASEAEQAARDPIDPRSAAERRELNQRMMYQASFPRTAPTQPTSIRASKTVMAKRTAITPNELRKILYVVGPIAGRAPAFAPVFGTQAYPYFKLFGFVNPEASIVLLKTAAQRYPKEFKSETLTDNQRDLVLRSLNMATQITIEDVLRRPDMCEDLASFCSSSLEEQERRAKAIFASMEDEDPNAEFARINPGLNKALALKSLQTVKAAARNIPKTPASMGVDFSEFFSWDAGTLVVGLPEADCFVSGIALARFLKARGFEADAKAIAEAHRNNTAIIQFTPGSADLRELVASSLGALSEFAMYAEQAKSITSNHVVTVRTQRNQLNMFNRDKNLLLTRPEYATFKKALAPAAVDYADLATPEGVFVLFNIVGEEAYHKQRELLRTYASDAPVLRRLLALAALGPYNLGIQRAWCNFVTANIPLMTALSQI